MPEIQPLNRPPAIALETVQPHEPVVRVNMACRPDDFHYEPTVFRADVIELDHHQNLTARWFWNYDPTSENPQASRDCQEERVRADVDVRRRLQPFELPRRDYDPCTDTGPLGTHTLELFVVEESALVDGPGPEPPFWRHLWRCDEDPNAPTDCVHTHPAVMRWTVVTYFEPEGCLPPEEGP